MATELGRSVGCETDAISVATSLIEEGLDYKYELKPQVGHVFTVETKYLHVLEEIIEELN